MSRASCAPPRAASLTTLSDLPALREPCKGRSGPNRPLRASLISFHGPDESRCEMDSEQGECGGGFGPRGSLHRELSHAQVDRLVDVLITDPGF